MLSRRLAAIAALAVPLLLTCFGASRAGDGAAGATYVIRVTGTTWSSNAKVRGALGALAGVADVQFDCKTATVKMKADAKLESKAAEKALVDAGFGMKEFIDGAAPTFAVARAQLKSKQGEPLSAAAIEKMAEYLAKEHPQLSEILIEPDGRLTALVKPDAKFEGVALGTTLGGKENPVAVEMRAWPRTATAYVATLGGKATDAATRAKAREAMEKIDVVVGAIERADGSFVVFTKEPCAALETRLKEALNPAGAELGKVGAR